jgi:hypothetical protein
MLGKSKNWVLLKKSLVRSKLSVLLVGLGLLSLFLLSWPKLSFAKSTIGITPSKFYFSLKPGQEVTGKIKLFNEGTEEVKYVSIYTANIEVDEEGNIRYHRPNEKVSIVKSPASWIALKAPDPTKVRDNLPYVDLPAKSSKTIDFLIRIPSKAPPGDHTAVIFFEMRSYSTEGAVIGGRVGAKVTLRVAGEFKEKISVDSFKVKPVIFGNKLPYKVIIKNLGNIDVQTDIDFYLKGYGESVKIENVSDFNILAGSKRGLSGTLALSSGLGPKDILLKATYGSNEAMAIARFFQIPAWAAYLLAVILTAGAGILWRRTKKKSDEVLSTNNSE